MNISNRSLVVLLVLTVCLVMAAGVMTLLGPLRTRTQTTVADHPAEASVLPVVKRHGDRTIDPKGPLLIEVERDSGLASALLVCDMYKSERPFVNGRIGFDSIPLGDCSLKLSGTETAFSPVYPGDRLNCVVEGTATTCSGGIATEKAGLVSVTSALPGRLDVDGEDKGELPLTDLRLRVGTRALTVHLTDGRTLGWKLVVQPEEQIEVAFPDPSSTTSEK